MPRRPEEGRAGGGRGGLRSEGFQRMAVELPIGWICAREEGVAGRQRGLSGGTWSPGTPEQAGLGPQAAAVETG